MDQTSPPPGLGATLALLDAATSVEHRFDRALSDLRGISFSEYQLLRAVARHGDKGVTRVALAEALHRTPSGVTRALRPLEKLGFARTTKDERDARRSLAQLTDQGQRLLADATVLVEDLAAELTPIVELDATQSEQLIDLFQRLAAR